MSLSRRQFAKHCLELLTAAPLISCKLKKNQTTSDLLNTVGPGLKRIQGPIRTRKEVFSAQKDLMLLEKALGYMRSSEVQKTGLQHLSLESQSNIHAEFCAHQSWRFLPWHRCYVSYFENVVRYVLVEKLNDPDGWEFALPYWNWDKNLIHPAFLDRGSSLFNETRNEEIIFFLETDGPLSTRAIVNSPLFENMHGSSDDRFLFSGGALEISNHSEIHIGLGGDMEVPLTSGLEPLFWLHHCYCDLIWERWIRTYWRLTNGRQYLAVNTPLGSEWAKEIQPGFYNELGQGVFPQTVDTLASENFGFRYDNVVRADPKPIPQVSLQSPLRRIQGTLIGTAGGLKASVGITDTFQKAFGERGTDAFALYSSSENVNANLAYLVLQIHGLNLRNGERAQLSLGERNVGKILAFGNHFDGFTVDVTSLFHDGSLPQSIAIEIITEADVGDAQYTLSVI